MCWWMLTDAKSHKQSCSVTWSRSDLKPNMKWLHHWEDIWAQQSNTKHNVKPRMASFLPLPLKSRLQSLKRETHVGGTWTFSNNISVYEVTYLHFWQSLLLWGSTVKVLGEVEKLFGKTEWNHCPPVPNNLHHLYFTRFLSQTSFRKPHTGVVRRARLISSAPWSSILFPLGEFTLSSFMEYFRHVVLS